MTTITETDAARICEIALAAAREIDPHTISARVVGSEVELVSPTQPRRVYVRVVPNMFAHAIKRSVRRSELQPR